MLRRVWIGLVHIERTLLLSGCDLSVYLIFIISTLSSLSTGPVTDAFQILLELLAAHAGLLWEEHHATEAQNV